MADRVETPNDVLKSILVAIQEQTEFAKNTARDLQQIRSMLTDMVKYMKDAESEVPEKMRRFIMYFHDAHDVINFYHELGLQPPRWVMQEVERCADRYHHLLDDLYTDKDGTFERVRQDMTKREGNRYDWNKLLSAR